MTRTDLFLLGAKRAIPIALGYIPVGTAYAVYAAQTGFTPWEIILISLTTYSGSGQFLVVSMTASGAALPIFAIALFLMNFRYFIMSTCVFNLFKKLSFLNRALFSHLVTDETFAIFTTSKKDIIGIPYFLGLFLTSWTAWVTGAVLGVIANSFLSVALTQALGIALFALFIAIIVPAGRSDLKVGLMIFGTAVLNTVLYQFLTESESIVISTVVCALVGAFFIKRTANCPADGKKELIDEEKRV